MNAVGADAPIVVAVAVPRAAAVRPLVVVLSVPNRTLAPAAYVIVPEESEARSASVEFAVAAPVVATVMLFNVTEVPVT